MSSVGVSKSVLSSPSQFKVIDVNASAGANELVLSQIKYEHKVELSLKQSQKEGHQKRMQSLRKELEYLNSTAWQFENTDKNICS